MNEYLATLNQDFTLVEPWVLRKVNFEDFSLMSEKEIMDWQTKRDTMLANYKVIVDTFNSVAPKLTSRELIEAYENSTNLFKNVLVGYMCSNYSHVYNETLYDAIKNDLPVAFRCISMLADVKFTDLDRALVYSLNSKYHITVETAVSLVGQLRLIHFKKHLLSMSKTSDEKLFLVITSALKRIKE